MWSAENQGLIPIADVNFISIELLKGINQARDILLSNTERFASNFPANNALLWGARGMGKSSLIKAIHNNVSKEYKGLILLEIHREDISSIAHLLQILREANHYRFIIFCDDLSFDAQDHTYKSLKAVLEGGIEGRPENVLFYATSNRRHLMPREMIENEQETAISPSEAVDEKVESDIAEIHRDINKASNKISSLKIGMTSEEVRNIIGDRFHIKRDYGFFGKYILVFESQVLVKGCMLGERTGERTGNVTDGRSCSIWGSNVIAY